jgi:hypothetical protein
VALLLRVQTLCFRTLSGVIRYLRLLILTARTCNARIVADLSAKPASAAGFRVHVSLTSDAAWTKCIELLCAEDVSMRYNRTLNVFSPALFLAREARVPTSKAEAADLMRMLCSLSSGFRYTYTFCGGEKVSEPSSIDADPSTGMSSDSPLFVQMLLCSDL